MYVSTAKVLRRFAEKVAGRRPFDVTPDEAGRPGTSGKKDAPQPPNAAPSTPAAVSASAGSGASAALDALQNTQLGAKAPAAAKSQGPEEAPRKGLAGTSTDKYVRAIENATRKPSLMHSALSGVDSAVDAGKSIGSMAKTDWLQNVNPYTMGAGGIGGAALLYAIAKMRQSDEDRKKGKQPILAPLLGGVGGAAIAPLLAAALTRANTSYAGGPLGARDAQLAFGNQAPEGRGALQAGNQFA